MEIRRIAAYRVKPWIIVSGFLIITVVVGICSLPYLLKLNLPQLIQQQTGRKTSLQGLDVALFPVRLTLQDFEIQEKNGQPFVTFKHFQVQINALQSIIKSALVIDKVLLEKPFVHIALEKNGAFNFEDLAGQDTKAEPDDNTLFPVIIAGLTLSEGKLSWQDVHRDKPVKEDIFPLNLQLDNFTTQTGQPFYMDLSLTLGSGGRLYWKGVAGLSPLSSEGRIKLDQAPLSRWSELTSKAINLKGTGSFDTDYQLSHAGHQLKLTAKQARFELQDFEYAGREQLIKVPALSHETDLNFLYDDKGWRFEAKKAKADSRNIQLSGLMQDRALINIPGADLEAAYQLTSEGKQLNVIVNKANFESRDVQLSEQGKGEALVKIPVIALQGIDFNLNNRTVAVESVSAKDADIKAWLTPDGVINYQTLFPSSSQTGKTASPSTPEQEQSLWKVKVGNLALNNFNAVFEDRTLKKPTTINFKSINFKLTDYSNQTGINLPFQLSIGVNKTGVITLSGETVVEPLAAKMKVDVRDVELEKFQPYYDKFVRLDVIDGGLNIDGNLALAKTAQDKLDVKFNGNAGIADLLTRDRKVNKDLVKWENFTLKGIAVDLPANRYIAASLDIDRPYARVTIRKDKTVNFSNIVINETDNHQTVAKTSGNKPVETNKPYFKLGKIKITGGSSDFTDLSLILPFAAHIKGLGGGASGVSSEKKSIVKVALNGNAYDLAPVKIKGEISPYLGDYNVEVKFDGLPMPLVSPYMVQFAGYKVEKGKMTLVLNYHVVNQQLTATNDLLIDQFELGEKVENPDAVSIPLKLAVALLKDANGKIKFNVPITGSLEDPKFSLGAIIADALFNAISKVVTSPFNAIASLFGGEEKSLSSVNFTAGNATLEKSEYVKLEELSKALLERPVLSLEIKGTAFQEQDWPAIRDDALFDQLKKRRADEINKEGIRKIRPEYVELSDEEYKRLLAELFIEKFPLLADRSLFGTPKLKDDKAGDFYAVAKQKLFEIIKPEEERLKELASARAQAIAKYMVQQGGVPQERVFILDTAIDPERDNNQIASLLSLTAN